MVARLNNDSAAFYLPYQRRMQQASVVALVVPVEGEGTGNSDSLYDTPLLQQAQAVLLRRLQVCDEAGTLLDGQPAGIRQIVAAANRHIQEMGGRLLHYPGLRPNHRRDGMGMVMHQPTF